MGTKQFSSVSSISLLILLTLLVSPLRVLAYPGDPGVHGEGDLDYNDWVDVMDEDFLIMFINGSMQPTQDQFFRADVYPYVISGGEHGICPQGDGVLDGADLEPIDKVMSGFWFFSSMVRVRL